MAARDRNLFAWQAYVIVTSIISLGLLVAVFLLWKTHTDLVKINAAKNDEATKLNSEKLLADKRVARLKAMLGYGENKDNYLADELKNDPEMQEVEKNFPIDMEVFSASEANKNYRQFPATLIDTIRARNKQLEDNKRELQRLSDEKAALARSEAEARAANDAAKKKAENDLAAVREQHAQEIAKRNQQESATKQLIDKLSQDLDAKNRQLLAQVNQLTEEKNKQAETITQQVEKLNALIDNDFSEPAGRVVNVADAGRKVWVNIGSADGLREGVSFVVLEENTRNVADAKVKARMVVERVLESHLAECTVTSGVSKNPVVRNDLVFSPAWSKGRTTEFALVGLIDTNNDGRDDRDLIKSLIQAAGGRVVAEILPDGKVENTPGMTNNTNWVIMGSDVVIGETATPEQRERANRYARFVNETKILGIPQMSTSRLLGYLKSKNDMRTIPLGPQTRGSDYPAEAPNSVIKESLGTVSDLFRERRPAKN